MVTRRKDAAPSAGRKFMSIDEYHASFPPAVRAMLDVLRQTIREAAPEAEEVISYNMPAFRQQRVLVYYAAYKNHIGLYPLPAMLDRVSSELSSYKTSKGAIQFPLDRKIPVSLVKKIVKFRLKEEA